MVKYCTDKTQKWEKLLTKCFKKKETWEDGVNTEMIEGCDRNIPNIPKINDGELY